MKVTKEDQESLAELLATISQKMKFSGKVEEVFSFTKSYSGVHALMGRIKDELSMPTAPRVDNPVEVVKLEEEPKKAPKKKTRKKASVGDRK